MSTTRDRTRTRLAPSTVRVAIGLVLSGLMLQACRTGDASGDSVQQEPIAAEEEPATQGAPESAGPQTDHQPGATAAEQDPEAGDVVRLYMDEPLEDRNPVFAHSLQYIDVSHYVIESLGRRDRTDPDVWHMALAETIEEVVPLQEYRVTLREGVRWHTPWVAEPGPQSAWLAEPRYVVSDDFVFLAELLANEGLELDDWRSGDVGGLESIRPISDTEFVVRWRSPMPGNANATRSLSPVPRWLYGANEEGTPLPESSFAYAFRSHWYNDAMVGTGPFRYAGRTPQGGILLERYADYWGTPAQLERIEFLIWPEDIFVRLSIGEGDAIALATDLVDELFEAEGPESLDPAAWGRRVFESRSFAYIGWNATRPAFEDAITRTAMTLAFDRSGLALEYFGTTATIVSGPYIEADTGADGTIAPLPFDLERAAALLQEAGWRDADNDGILERNGESLRFVLLGNWGWSYLQPAFDEFGAALEEIGVEMRTEWVSPYEFSRRVDARDFDATFSTWWMGYDPSPRYMWHSDASAEPGEGNLVGFSDPELDELLDAHARSVSPDEQRELLRQIQQRIHDAQPYSFWFSPEMTAIWRRSLRDVSVSELRPHVSVREARRDPDP